MTLWPQIGSIRNNAEIMHFWINLVFCLSDYVGKQWIWQGQDTSLWKFWLNFPELHTKTHKVTKFRRKSPTQFPEKLASHNSMGKKTIKWTTKLIKGKHATDSVNFFFSHFHVDWVKGSKKKEGSVKNGFFWLLKF